MGSTAISAGLDGWRWLGGLETAEPGLFEAILGDGVAERLPLASVACLADGSSRESLSQGVNAIAAEKELFPGADRELQQTAQRVRRVAIPSRHACIPAMAIRLGRQGGANVIRPVDNFNHRTVFLEAPKNLLEVSDKGRGVALADEGEGAKQVMRP